MAVLSIKHSMQLLNGFIESVDSKENAYYVFVGKPTPWPNEPTKDVVTGSVGEIEQDIYQDMVYAKIINPLDVSYMAQRYDWVSNTVYAYYDNNDATFISKNFYVFTDDNNVYKCIFNGDGAPSTIKPSLTSLDGVFSTADGYVWKYMYTIDAGAITKFNSNNYISVVENTDVKNNAIPGSIDYIKIVDGGINYEVYEEGFIVGLVNNFVFQLPDTSSYLDNYYTNSSIYLKDGLGGGQIRKITSYDGLNRLGHVDENFDTYITVQLANVAGTIEVGQVASQELDSVNFLYKSGFVAEGDVVMQTDTGAEATVKTANSSALTVERMFGSNSFILSYPVFNTNDTGTLKTGNVTIVTGQSNVVGNGTTFTTDYAINQYIRVGDDANNNIRRVTSVTNNTMMAVSQAWAANLTSNTHHLVTSAIEPDSITLIKATGDVISVNLNGLNVSIDQPSIDGVYFISGETVDLVNVTNVKQGSNATVAFANTSTVILSNVNGTFTQDLYLSGTSSSLKAHITSVDTFPSMTIASDQRKLVAGENVYTSAVIGGSQIGSAEVIASYTIPNQLTQYVISPTVTIEGDGTGALAYAVINTEDLSTSIDRIQMINNGMNYTYANVTITSNTSYGSGANASPLISPVMGHGSNVYEELGARYAGISLTFDTLTNESYKFPAYGNYRKIGIIKNPMMQEALVNLDTFDRVKLGTANGLTFTTGEVVVQPSGNAAGVVVFSNSSFVELNNVQGTFLANTAGDNIYGLVSTKTANVKTANVSYFRVVTDGESLLESVTGATATIIQAVSNNQIRIANVIGQFTTNNVVIDASTNSYANVVSILTSNGIIDSSQNFGQKINQTARIGLSSNTLSFSPYETIVQAETNATGTLINMVPNENGNVVHVNDIDLLYSGANGTFTVGDIITNNNTLKTGVVIGANTSYLKLTAVEGLKNDWAATDTFINTSGTQGTITDVYSVLVVNNITNSFQISSSSLISGKSSGAEGFCTIKNTLTYPDLVKNSGEVIYLENVEALTKSTDSKETVKVTIKF